MERVVDAIQQNLPVQMSLTHWKVGPMMGSFDNSDESDIKAQTAASTFASAAQYDSFSVATRQRQANFSGSQYDLGDEDMAMAAAAAAAAVAMQHNQPAKKLPREHLQEAFQSMRDSQTPRKLVQNVREQTPQLVHKVVQNVRDHVHGWQHPEHDNPVQEGPTSEYCDALNESYQQQHPHHYQVDEAREQPPMSSSASVACELVWHQLQTKRSQLGQQLQNSQLIKKLPPQLQASLQHVVTATTTTSTRANADAAAAECYVSFSDGNAQDAIAGFTRTNHEQRNNSSSVPQQHMFGPPLSKRTTVSTGSSQATPREVSDAGYADMQDEDLQQVVSVQRKGPAHVEANSASHPSTPPNNKNDDNVPRATNGSAVHSTASYQWGAPSSSDVIVEHKRGDTLSKDTGDQEAGDGEEKKVDDEHKSTNVATTPQTESIAMHSTARYQWGASAASINETTTTVAKQELHMEEAAEETSLPHQQQQLQQQQDEDTVETKNSLVVEDSDEEASLADETTPVAEEPMEELDLLQLESASSDGNSNPSSTEALPSPKEEDEAATSPAGESPAMHSTAKFHWGASSTCQPSPRVQ